MDKHEHLLVCLIEECAEVQQAATKALRFGLQDGYPGSSSTNAEDIAKEWIDLVAIVEMLIESDLVPGCLPAEHLFNSGVLKRIDEKKARVRQYMEYAIGTGALHDR